MWLLDLFLLYRLPQPVTRDQLGYLGGKPHFNLPAPDYVSETRQGVAPSTPSSAREMGWYRL